MIDFKRMSLKNQFKVKRQNVSFFSNQSERWLLNGKRVNDSFNGSDLEDGSLSLGKYCT